MYFALYDRNLKTIGETYILESWHRIQRSLDFDELTLVGEQTPYYADPFIVSVQDKYGNLFMSGLASTPIVDEDSKKASISLKDYLTLFNSEIIVDWSSFTGSSVSEYLDFLLQSWLTQTDVGFSTIRWEFLFPYMSLGNDLIFEGDKESALLYELINDAMGFYDLYCIPELNIFKKTLTFKFYKSGVNHVSVNLRDLGILHVEKSFGDYNRVTIYDHEWNLIQQWALTEDNSIRKLSGGDLSLQRVLYPAKNRNFIAKDSSQSSLYDTIYDALMGLSGNRFQESIDIPDSRYSSLLGVTELDFSYMVDTYSDQGFYRSLPVGEIETDSNGKHIVRLGHRVQELTQEV